MARRRASPGGRFLLGLAGGLLRVGVKTYMDHAKHKARAEKDAKRQAVRSVAKEIRSLQGEARRMEKDVRELRELSAMVQFQGLLENLQDENERLRKELGRA